MRLLADENFPYRTIEILRRDGFDVYSIRERHPGIPDEEVLTLCASDQRLLVTLDKDFGELAFRQSLLAACGIVLVRLVPQSPEEIASVLLSALGSRGEWSGIFAVVTRDKLRLRTMPRQ